MALSLGAAAARTGAGGQGYQRIGKPGQADTMAFLVHRRLTQHAAAPTLLTSSIGLTSSIFQPSFCRPISSTRWICLEKYSLSLNAHAVEPNAHSRTWGLHTFMSWPACVQDRFLTRPSLTCNMCKRPSFYLPKPALWLRTQPWQCLPYSVWPQHSTCSTGTSSDFWHLTLPAFLRSLHLLSNILLAVASHRHLNTESVLARPPRAARQQWPCI